MPDRFANLSLEQLVEREAEARAEVEAVAKALKARLVAECPVKIGCIYRFTDEALPWRRGKEFLVCAIRAENFSLFGGDFAAGIHGYSALKNSTAGDGFGIRATLLRDWRVLDIATERPGHRAGLVEYAALVAKIESEACDGRL